MPVMSKGRRNDVSNFIIHLSRDFKPANKKADDNLIKILKNKKIEARNYHCLFGHAIRKSKLTSPNKSKFKTACFTETPIDQILNLTEATDNRKILLRGFGLVFRRSKFLKDGGNPAIYINGNNDLKRELIDEFDALMNKAEGYAQDKRQSDLIDKCSMFYSLINIISTRYDFTWEREWRFVGDYKFNYSDVVAIIAENPADFKEKIKKHLSALEEYKFINKIPIISPEWNHEELIDELCKSRQNA